MELTVDYEKTASFDVDAQKGFTNVTGELPVPDGENIVEYLNKQAEKAKYRVGSKDAHPMGAYYFTTEPEEVLSLIFPGDITKDPNYLEFGHPVNMDVYWPPHCIVGTDGFDLLEGLPHPINYDFFVYKGLEEDVHPYGACYHDLAGTKSTGVVEFLRANGVINVIVGGLATDYCVKTTAVQLKAAGFNVIVNLESSRGVDVVTTKSAVDEMIDKGIHVVDDLSEVKVIM